MATNETLVPSFVNFMYDGTEFLIVGANISLRFSNSSRFEESITNKGTKGYMLRKGVTVEQDGDISVKITKAGDNNADGTIKNMQKIAKNISKSENPKDYAKDIVINFSDSGEQKFFSVSFKGYLKTFNVVDTSNNNFTNYIAEFEIFDPLTIKLSN